MTIHKEMTYTDYTCQEKTYTDYMCQEMTYTDYMCQEKKDEEDLPSLVIA